MANHDVVERTVIGTPETRPNGPIIIARHRDEKSVKGVKLNLKKDKQKISVMESAFRRGGPATRCKRITSQHHVRKTHKT